MKRIKLLISGRVQGVYYRQSTMNFASQFSVTGYVCNLPTGQVCAEIQGNVSDLKEIMDWCHQGPQQARVTSVEEEEMEVLDSESSFEIRREEA